MRKIALLLSIGLLALGTPSCTQLEAVASQLSPFISAENVSLQITTSFLKKHPGAVDDLNNIATELHMLATDNVLSLDELYSDLEAAIIKSDAKDKQDLLALVKSLINEYELVFKSDTIDVSKYSSTLKGLASGIDGAIAIYLATHPVPATVTK